MKILIILIAMAATTAWAGTNNVSLNIQRSMISNVIDLQAERQIADDIVKAYFATGSNDLIDGLAENTTPATVGSKLTKSKFVNGVTMAQQIQNLFTAQVVSTGDYLATIHNLLNGSDAAAQPLSQDVEVIGTKLV